MKKKILVIDDEAMVVEYTKRKLEHCGYEALTACDGQEGFEIARKNNLDLVVTDISMPNMDGLTLCEKLRESEGTSGIPIIVCSAYTDREGAFRKLGVYDFLEKPFNEQALLDAVARNLIKSVKHIHDKKILLQGENTPSIQMAVKQFNELGYNIVLQTTQPGYSLIEEALRFQPDIIIGDAAKEGNGLNKLIKSLRDYVILKDIILIFFINPVGDKIKKKKKGPDTATQKLKESVLAAGATDYIDVLDRESFLTILFQYCKV